MQLRDQSVAVVGGASGLGLAAARTLAARGARVTVIDLPHAGARERVEELGASVRFEPADVTDAEALVTALDRAHAHGGLRVAIHTAGRGGRVRVLERDGAAGDLDAFAAIQRVNVIGSFNVLRLAAERMAANDPVDAERGVVILTASVAAYEGQIGQLGYAASKAAVVGMTITAARDLASKQIRVCSIAPGVFETPMIAGVRDDVRAGLVEAVPNPRRLGRPEEYADLAAHIVENPYLNGETIRLDGALRMAPR